MLLDFSRHFVFGWCPQFVCNPNRSCCHEIIPLTLTFSFQFEKEVKNSFISELIRVQNKRRQMAGDRKKRHSGTSLNPNDLRNSGPGKYLNTIIPYEPGASTRHMQALIKILQAINEDSPTTPTLLTDYILKVLCPKD